MSSSLKKNAISSSSLQGMERPVRSFKSFIRTVPPHLKSKHKKPLPPPPPPPSSMEIPISLSATSSQLDFRERNLSTGSWKAPAEWCNSATPSRRASDSSIIPPKRTYSPMIPEPSPDLLETQIGPLSWQLTSIPSQQTRLQPIDERLSEKSDMSKIHPYTSPPRSPSQQHMAVNTEPEDEVTTLDLKDVEDDTAQSEVEAAPIAVPVLCLQAASPTIPDHAYSTPMHPSIKQAFTSFGVDSEDRRMGLSEDSPYSSDHEQLCEAPIRQHKQARKLFNTNRGDLLDDDIWEDVDMDERARKLSFSQDYHDLLVNQYHEMNAHAESAKVDSLDSQNDNHTQEMKSLKDNSATPQAATSNEELEVSLTHSSHSSWHPEDPTQKAKQKRKIVSWVPQRLSHKTKDPPSKRELDHLQRDSSASKRQDEYSDLELPKGHRHDLGISTLLHTNKPLKLGKKHSGGDAPLAISKPVEIVSSNAQLAAAPTPLSADQATVEHAKHTSRYKPCPSTGQPYFSPYSESPLLAPEPSKTDSSADSPHGQLPTKVPEKRLGAFDVPLYTRPPPQEIPRSSPPPPPPPPVRPTFTKSPPLSREAWRPVGNTDESELRKPRFLDRAREARRRHNRDSRQEKLKKSIKVVGPTDPSVMAGYVR